MAKKDLGFFKLSLKSHTFCRSEADRAKQETGPQTCWSQVLHRQEQQEVQFLQDVRAKEPSGAGELHSQICKSIGFPQGNR